MKTVLLLLFIYSSSSWSEELASPVFLSQGGAGGASLKEDISYLINPATIGFQKRTKTALYYSFKQKKQTALLSFLDLKTQIPLAVTYQRSWSKSFKKSKEDIFLLSSGFPILPYLSLGLTLKKQIKSSDWNGRVGSLLRLGNQLSMGLFVNQVLKRKNNPRALSLAFYYNWKHFFSTNLEVSKLEKDKEWVFRGGFESLFQNFLSLRLGGVWFKKTKKGLISGGLAFYSPKGTVEYSIQKESKTYQQVLALILKI